jgi:type II secretory pathway component GspD/PulD (secretin)
VGLPAALGQASVRPARVHGALNSGIDCYRRADYETAATYFQQAEDGKDELSADERQELSNMLRLNNTALKARREGAEQLGQAERAVQAGRTAEADAILKLVLTNQFLSGPDKAKALRLLDRVRGGAPLYRPEGSGMAPSVLARTKLQQARVLMAKGNYDAAQTLAREAAAVNAVYLPGEDTPAKVIDDIAKTRGNAKALLAAARNALQNGDYDQAERLALTAQQTSSRWTFTGPWSDSPAKVLKDVQLARARQPATIIQVGKPASEGAAAPPVNPNEAARQLLKQGRKALQAGDLDQAQQCATQAQSLNVDFHWWEDNPGKLLTDVQRAQERAPRRKNPGNPPMSSRQESSSKTVEEDPHVMLQNARGLYDADKLDEAEQMALHIQANYRNTTWSLFDSPDKLLLEIRKARLKHSQDDSVRVLAEARKLFQQGDLEGATTKAYQAQNLHGSYSFWDLGDRPDKLIAEIQAAQAKNHKVQLPPAPGQAMAKKDAQPPQPVAAVTNAGKPVNSPGYSTYPDMPPGPDAPSGVKTAGYVNESPKERAADVNKMAGNAPVPAAAPMPPVIVTTDMPEPVKAPATPKARLLLTEAKDLELAGQLVEARQKALEAQKAGFVFGADEPGPDQVLLRLTAQAHRRIEHLMQEATDLAATGFTDASRYERAQENLIQAQQLAVGFALDTQAIDAKLSWVRHIREQALAAPQTPRPDMVATLPTAFGMPQPVKAAPPEPPAPPGSLKETGQKLLDSARTELSRGETENARRFAVQVYNGRYGLKAQADAILHSIDAEEYNQRVLAANREFKAGVAAYANRDYVQAASILRSLDPTLLTPDKQAKIKELTGAAELQAKAAAQASKPVAQASLKAEPESAAPGKATVSDAPGHATAAPNDEAYVHQVQAMQDVKYQQLRVKGLEAQAKATRCFSNNETQLALDTLQEYLDDVQAAGLEPERTTLLLRPVEHRLAQLKSLKAQQDFANQQASAHDTFAKQRSREAQAEAHKKEQVAALMKQYHEYYKQAKYKEAEMEAEKARELDPDDVQIDYALSMARIQEAHARYDEVKKSREDHILKDLDSSEDEGPVVDEHNPVYVDKKSLDRAKNRKVFPTEGVPFTFQTEKEKEIEHKLNSPISLDFKDAPLGQVIDDLHNMTGINMVIDKPALNADNISLSEPITIHLEGVSMKSALNLVLHQAHLIYIIKYEVLQVTTEAYAKGTLIQKTYQVADLVIPVENTSMPEYMDLQRLMDQTPKIGSGTVNGRTPYTGPLSLPNGSAVDAASQQGSDASRAPAGGVSVRQRGSTIEDVLIKMITNTIKPETWSAMGGPGTIEYYPLGMALVVSQTPDIQEQIAELLTALRRLQDMEVAVEVRFITIDEAFFERIGLDFNVNIVQNNTKWSQLLVAQQFQPFGFNNNFTPSGGFVSGLTLPTGGIPGSNGNNAIFTPDLGIPIKSSSFGPAIPPFGGYPNTPGTDGGLSLGLAFLSDIQVFMFMEAAQGDVRTNVMRAPKLTLFNGQTSTLTVSDVQFFVTAVNFIQANGQIVISPQNTLIPTNGISVSINAVISADRRFVRMSLPITIDNVTNVTTALFPITTFITPVFDNGAQGQPIPFTQFIEQPAINTITVNTTVNVPDGGTVLLGGLKSLREGRTEFGPPVLSKIPYISRLFKNTGYGRDTESLLMLVTPRVIINEEEETRMTGVGAGLGLPGAAAQGGGPQP